MSLGAYFASLLAMVNSIAVRSKEFATLRAIGYTRFPLAVSVLIEALMVALVGAIIGSILIFVFLDGLTANSSFMANTQYVFQFRVTQQLILVSLMVAALIGIASGIFPAVHAVNKSLGTELK
jgi:putative ABC transport system permease protein